MKLATVLKNKTRRRENLQAGKCLSNNELCWVNSRKRRVQRIETCVPTS
jgi:hypothetical protein